jgi:Zn-dependent peptidase ImmA (M78 family)
MKIEGLKVLSKIDIDAIAQKVIARWCPEILDAPKPFPLLKFCETLQKDHEVRISFESDLGANRYGKKIFGCFSLDPKGIFIDACLQGDVRFPFVLAHEIGHLMLHWNVNFEKEDYESLMDLEENITNRNEKRSDVDWLEWQANKFASCILMPRQTLPQALDRTFNSLGIRIGRGKIYVSNNSVHLKDYYSILETMAKIYGVSEVNIEYRLKSFDLIEDYRSLPSYLSRIKLSA